MWPRLVSNSLSSCFLSAQITNVHYHGRTTGLEDRRKGKNSFMEQLMMQRRQGESSMGDDFGEEARGVVLNLQKGELGLPGMRKHVFLSEATREVLQISI